MKLQKELKPYANKELDQVLVFKSKRDGLIVSLGKRKRIRRHLYCDCRCVIM